MTAIMVRWINSPTMDQREANGLGCHCSVPDTYQPVASTRVQDWGDEAPKGYALSPGRGVWKGQSFVISKWHILVILRC